MVEWKVTCPKCGSRNTVLCGTENFELPRLPYEAHAKCNACGWRSGSIYAHNHTEAFAILENVLTPPDDTAVTRPRTIIDKLRSMSDEQIVEELANAGTLHFCDFCETVLGSCDADDHANDQRCKERIRTILCTPLTKEKEDKPMQEMTLNEYQRLAQRTSNSAFDFDDFRTLALKKIDNGILGLCGETGECADIWKKTRHQGHTLDADKLADECGDVLWYVAELAAGLGLTLEAIARHNIEKLEKRYPKGHFEAERSINRDGSNG